LLLIAVLIGGLAVKSVHLAQTRPKGAYRIGGGVSAPVVIYKVEPGYSEEARIARVEGTSILFICRR